MQKIIGQIAQELNVKPQQVSAAVELLDGGATVPFVARYRKEATGGLDDTQLRTLDERLTYLRELDDRRETVLKAIDEMEQGLVGADLGGNVYKKRVPCRGEEKAGAAER